MKLSLKNGLLLGLLIGLASAVLYTPKSGKELREGLKDKVDKVPFHFFNFLESLIDLTLSVLDFAKSAFQEQRERLSSALSTGIAAARVKADELKKYANSTQSVK